MHRCNALFSSFSEVRLAVAPGLESYKPSLARRFIEIVSLRGIYLSTGIVARPCDWGEVYFFAALLRPNMLGKYLPSAFDIGI